MDIWYIYDKIGLKDDGASFAACGVLDQLRIRGNLVRLFGQNNAPEVSFLRDSKNPFLVDGDMRFWMRHYRWLEYLNRTSRTEKLPQIILTQGYLTPAAVQFGKQHGIPVVIFIHGWESLSPLFFTGIYDPSKIGPLSWHEAKFRQKIKWPLVNSVIKAYKSAYENAHILIANSHFVANCYEQYFSQPIRVIYPTLDLVPLAEKQQTFSREPFESGKKKVLLLKPTKQKGLDRVIYLAKKFPHITFKLVGTSKTLSSTFKKMNNVECHGFIADKAKIFKDVNLILGPVNFPEPFGRVFVEAGLFGVPSLALGVGGIPEAIGDGGLCLPPLHTGGAHSDWGEAMEFLLEDDTNREYGIKAHKHASQLVFDGPKRFNEVFEDLNIR